MLNNQSIAEMTLQDLESLIDRIVDEKINQINVAKNNKIERNELVNKIHILQENLKQKYDVFPILTELREDIDNYNPFVEFDGIFKDDPFFDDFVEEMANNRRELDAEIGENEE
ncbi:hypothetical protein [Sphaerospermopsis sp. LEGE 08334]|uniref:hypothetical protein n=1 Tax=Sphaerospermopsis sp. LEGE 08334 TaxID=1828651 RepID=UPI00187FF79B|nr:hypothetical protein [Sphaerospermopsis sp. LEGE 08334]MBE9057766.1 hypothetical protein [Sphaerospermopsis sp. LEGE 08334]